MQLDDFRAADTPAGRLILNPADLGPHINVPLRVWPVRGAGLLWLNDRWLLENGVDVTEPDVRTRISHSILEAFAVSTVPSPGMVPLRHLGAERYGGTGGAVHGGSGRCGSAGDFNAKGIGRTPLVSEAMDIYHKHGWLSLSEALREAVNAEIADIELPYGGVPVVAIIDTGRSFQVEPDSPWERAAIVVRPNFVRPAHFERSIFFGDSGHPAAQQFIDAQRVRDAVTAAAAAPARYPSLTDMFLRFSRQIGAARAKRLWQGQFLTSNLSVDGALADFGSFRSVPNWRATVGQAGERFGTELTQLRKAMLSLAFYITKYAGDTLAALDLRAFLPQIEQAEADAFADACRWGLGLEDPAAADLTRALQDYYQLQQATRLADNVPEATSWLYDFFSPTREPAAGPRRELALGRHIRSLFDRAASGNHRESTSLNKARRFLCPQPMLSYQLASGRARRIEQAIAAGHPAPARLVETHIRGQVARHRRSWATLPTHLDVIGRRSGSDLLHCLDLRTGASCLWLEGYRLGDRAVLDGRAIPLSSLDREPRSRGNRIGIALPFDDDISLTRPAGDRTISLTPA